MKRSARRSKRTLLSLATSATLIATIGGCANRGMPASDSPAAGSDGPADQGKPLPRRQDGDARAGREAFRFETFGNEGFWTDAVRLPAGMMAARVTPLQALELGVQIDVDALDAATRDALAAQLKADPTGRSSALLNDPAVTAKLISANAVIGMPIKDSNGDGVLDATKGDKVGASCALCHTMADGSVFRVPNGGAVGHRQDGLANHVLNLGKIFATAANSRALYPVLQLALRANGGKTLGRAPTGLTETSTEAEVDAYLSNPAFYPVGMFDDTFDGNGDPMHNTPLFRQDLAAPYGSEGTIARLDNFSNLVYTSLFDQTMLTTSGGRAFLHKLGGAAGDEIADNYVKVLAATGVTGYPYVKAAPHPMPGSEDAPVGVRVDNATLLNLNAYLVSLQAPRGATVDAGVFAEGRQTFRTAGCTSCHNADQSRPVPTTIVAMKTIFPGDNPVTLAERTPPLNPVLNTVESIFDDKMAVVNASLRGEIRGTALPLLLDLARKPVFLHDNSVPTLDALLDPQRGPTAPHPFYLSNPRQRGAVVSYLRGLDARDAARR
ncbi:MAG: hypothetical protein ACR2OG_03560 [Gemmatimonadaceae bacterium]